jgi:hypothetical protein
MRTISIFRAGDGAGRRRNKEAVEVRDFCRLRWASDRDATERKPSRRRACLAETADESRSRGPRRLLRGIRALGRSNRGDSEIRFHDQIAVRLSGASPYLAMANRQAEIMMRIASEFGFTPASRSRIATPSQAEPSLFDVLDGEAPAGPLSGSAAEE